MDEALISIKPTYVSKLISGEKSVEIRNRAVNLSSGSRLWIYSTLPKGSIEAVAEIHRVVAGHPSDIWHRYSSMLAVSEGEFGQYVNGSNSVSAIIMKHVWRLPIEVPLSLLRLHVPGFQPPQFLKYKREIDPSFSAIVDLVCRGSCKEFMNEIGLTHNSKGNDMHRTNHGPNQEILFFND